MGRLVGIFCAILLHAAFLLFGGLLFGIDAEGKGRIQDVELLTETPVVEDREPKIEETKELKAEAEPPPDAAEIIRNLEQPAPADAPALDAASLGAIEQALGGGGGGDLAGALGFASGGRLGGTGRGGALDDTLERAFSLAEIDQKPRALFQVDAAYPSELRGKKLEGVVTVFFVVDPSGKVASPRVEKSTHPAFDKPALDAVKQWKFEAAVRSGQRVACKMRVSLRFPPR